MSRKWHRFIIVGCRISHTKRSTICNPLHKISSKRYFDQVPRYSTTSIKSDSPQLEGSSSTSNDFSKQILHATAYESHGTICWLKFIKLPRHIIQRQHKIDI